jgi:uncharacterized repeat protein (TIGR01451 family)
MPLGGYVVRELVNQNQFEKQSVRCNGRIFPFAQGQTVVRLTDRQPDVSCTFTNLRVKPPEPPLVTPGVPQPIRPGTPGIVAPPTEPQAPDQPRPPEQTGPPLVGQPGNPDRQPVRGVPPEVLRGAPKAPGAAAVPTARLRVTKKVSRKRIRLGETVTYTISVRNLGPDTAQDVVAFEDSRAAGLVRSLRTDRGSCQIRVLPRSCDLGQLAPGESVRIVARVQPTGIGAFTNRVAVGSTTASGRVEVHRGAATLRTLRRAEGAIGFTG